MEFEEIIIENFCTIEYVKLKLNQPGLILVQGVNKDATVGFESNGAGKSLLLDAICWCLWDETTRKLSGDAVVRRQHGKDCHVSLRMREGKTTYIVSRHRMDTRIDKPNDLRLFINGVEKTKKMKGLQSVIDQIVGFDFVTFCAMMPGAGVNVATLTDTGIKELLEKLLQTEQLSSAYAQARERLRTLDHEIAQHEATKLSVNNQLRALNSEVHQLRLVEETFETNKAARVQHLKDKLTKLDADLAECQAEIDKCVPLIQQAATFKNEIKVLTAQAAAIEQPAQQRTQLLKANIGRLDRVVNANQQEFERCMSERTRVMEMTGACPTCLAPIHAEHVADAVAVLNAQAAVANTALVDAQKERDTVAADLKEHVSKTGLELAELQGQIAMKKMAYDQLIKAADESARFQKLQVRYQTERTSEEQQLKIAEAETHDFAAVFKSKAEKAFDLVQQLAGALSSIRTLAAEQKLCQFWVDGFSPAGLRSYMLDYVTPVLNDRAAYYAQVLTGDEMKVSFTTKKTLKKGGEKDQFQIFVEYAHGGDLYKGTSKGEKARADLVIAMALGDLATFRTAKQLPWRFLDEPFESIDDAGNGAVMNLLNDQKTRFKTVFVVTHKPAFKKLFTQQITMVKENSVSTLVKDFQ